MKRIYHYYISMSFSVMLGVMLTLISGSVFAQSATTVSGTVTDVESGEAIIGATVNLEGGMNIIC
ncbi:MAG: hypothetical protein ACFHWX_09225 [Bacteroidota bacterium]